VMPRRELFYARLCPFCRKERGKIQSTGRETTPGHLPEMRVERTEAQESSGSAQGLEWKK